MHSLLNALVDVFTIFGIELLVLSGTIFRILKCKASDSMPFLFGGEVKVQMPAVEENL